MNTYTPGAFVTGLRALVLGAALLPVASLQARVLDNFDSGKSGWSDFTFDPRLGPSFVDGGQLKFMLPPVGQSIAIASQKTSELFELKEGRTVEFRTDVTAGGGPGNGGEYSYAVLSFIPKDKSPGFLQGYSLSLSTTDVLITKGINKYFVDDTGIAAARTGAGGSHAGTIDNVTMVLNMTVKDGNVVIHAMVLDKDPDADKPVLWERTVIDTPAPDPLSTGTDDGPNYITSGYYTLYLFENWNNNHIAPLYQMSYDNAEVFVTETTVLDDFESGKTGWTDFTFDPRLGPSFVDGGQLKFMLPPVGQSIAIASQKTTRLFELKEGEIVEFRTDVTAGGGPGNGGEYSYAVLSFIPKDKSPGFLQGYSISLSTTDVLITKGINKYFVDDTGIAAARTGAGGSHAGTIDNVTMVLNMTVKDGNVVIHAMVLDKDPDADKPVLWERTVIDTPAPDPLSTGTDDGPNYITSGYYTLYLFENWNDNHFAPLYQMSYDNAIVQAPPVAANTAPLITDYAPTLFANLLPAATDVSFTTTDDAALDESKLSITLNGTVYSTANGLLVTGTPDSKSKTATLKGKLAVNTDYTAVLSVTDAGNVTSTSTIYFDTFDTTTSDVIVVEAEDYNFGSGVYITAPVAGLEGSDPDPSSYNHQTGTPLVDYYDTRTSANGGDTKYRPGDAVRMQHSLDLPRARYTDLGGADSGYHDYDVIDLAGDEWLNYTREFPPGNYAVYLREAVANLAVGVSVLEMVTSDPSLPDQTTSVVGAFIGVTSGFSYRNFVMTDGGGQSHLTVNLSGATTLRLRQITADTKSAARALNYLVFVRVGDIQSQPATINSVSPAPGSTVRTVTPQIQVQILNHDTTVNPGSIQLTVNGSPVSAVITPDAGGATVTYDFPELPPVGSVITAKVSCKDNLDHTIQSTWQFTITYPTVNPAYRISGAPGDSGWSLHVVQAPAGSKLIDSILSAEEQIKPGSVMERIVDVTDMAATLNYNTGSTADVHKNSGYFPDDLPIPGIDPATTGNGIEDFTVEMVTYLSLPKGIVRFGVLSDDGYKLTAGSTLHDAVSGALASHTGGTADERVDVYVPVAGLYPFRALWYNHGGPGQLELFTEDRATGAKTLLNDPTSDSSIKAYMNVVLMAVQSSASVTGPYADEASAVVDVAAKTATLNPTGDARFYRLVGGSAVTIQSIQIIGGKVVLSYQ